MTKKKTNLIEVRITGPQCWLDDRRYLPGETAAVPAETAREWTETGRAVYVTAEVEDGDRRDS
jgi:hypothetical protein